MSYATELENLTYEARRLREALDTIDWLLHVSRVDDPRRLTTGDTVKRDVVELVRSVLGAKWFEDRNLPL